MAGQRIPDLTAITAAGVANDDYFLIFDSSTNTTKKILKSEVSTLFTNGLAAADVIAKLLTVDGPGSLLDADLLDGVHAAAFALLTGAAFSGAVSVAGNFTHTGTVATFGKAVIDELTASVPSIDLTSNRALNSTDINVQLFADSSARVATINTGVFSKGQWVVLHGGSAGARFSRGSGVTMYSDNTNTSDVYIRERRSAVAVFDSATVCRIIGGTTSPPP